MQQNQKIVVKLPPLGLAGLRKYAMRHRLSEEGAGEKIIVEAVAPELSTKDRAQIAAELDVMTFVEQEVERQRVNSWDDRVIERVFEAIRDHALADYQTAIGGSDPFAFGQHEKARINRRIGKRVRQLLGAIVMTNGGARQKGQPSRTVKSLIMSYTLLAHS